MPPIHPSDLPRNALQRGDNRGTRMPEGRPDSRLPTISGTTGDDSLTALPTGSRLVGLAGDDTLIGGTGNDVIQGGDGNDLLAGGAGNDRLAGGAGDDLVFGTDGNDVLSGGAGDDILAGGLDNDIINGGAGSDIFYFRFMTGDTPTAVDGRDVIQDFTTRDLLLLDDLVDGTRAGAALDLSTTFAATDASGITVTSIGDSTVLGFAGGSIRLDGVSGFSSISGLENAGYNIRIG